MTKLEVRRRRLRQILDSLIGALLCAIAAVGVSVVALGHRWEVLVPLLFVIILVGISAIFGARAGILGTILAAIIFAGLLFRPVGSIHVSDDAARSNLAWMLLLGISFSFLFAPPTSGFRRD
jgi:K+-sensing histidine kinase KdpD